MKSSFFRFIRISLIAVVLTAVVGLASPAVPARAANFNPVTVLDLINAINTANTNGQNDVIDLGGEQFTIDVVDNGENGLPVILADGGKTLTIQNGSIIRDVSGPAFRILEVGGGANLTLTNVTVRYGSAFEGGGIYNSGTVVISKSSLLDNYASNAGGGLRNLFGTVTITDSLLNGNNSLSGGAISNSGALTIDRSLFSNNISSANGGAINNITNLAVTITNSTFYNNSSMYGGAIENNATNQLTIVNSTFYGNSAIFSGGTLLIDYGGVTFKNTIIHGGGCVGPGLTADSFNIDTDGTCGNATTLTSGQIDLQPLGSNGGPTQTMALGAGSLAIDAGDNSVCNAGPVNNLDQRGYLRINGTNITCDAGAHEAGGVMPPTVDISITSINFGIQPIGVASSPQTVTITNIGGADLHIGTLGISGEFSLSNDTCSGVSVAPSGTCTFDVTFQPLSTGPKAGSASIPSNAASTPDSVSLNGTGINPLSATFTSLGNYDGYVIESGETTGFGGTATAIGGVLMVGDDRLDRQMMSFLHFDTSSLPDNAIITGITLRIKQQSIFGTNPFSTHGPLYVDFGTPFFGAETALKKTDFQAYPSMNYQGPFSATPLVGNWYEAFLADPSELNRTGSTQFRLHFNLDDNDDNGMDMFRFFSGNYPSASYRPTLIVEYYVP